MLVTPTPLGPAPAKLAAGGDSGCRAPVHGGGWWSPPGAAGMAQIRSGGAPRPLCAAEPSNSRRPAPQLCVPFFSPTATCANFAERRAQSSIEVEKAPLDGGPFGSVVVHPLQVRLPPSKVHCAPPQAARAQPRKGVHRGRGRAARRFWRPARPPPPEGSRRGCRWCPPPSSSSSTTGNRPPPSSPALSEALFSANLRRCSSSSSSRGGAAAAAAAAEAAERRHRRPKAAQAAERRQWRRLQL